MVSSACTIGAQTQIQKIAKQPYLESGSVNDEGTRSVPAILDGVYDDKVMKAMVEERQGSGKARWTCSYDENSGAVRE